MDLNMEGVQWELLVYEDGSCAVVSKYPSVTFDDHAQERHDLAGLSTDQLGQLSAIAVNGGRQAALDLIAEFRAEA